MSTQQILSISITDNFTEPFDNSKIDILMKTIKVVKQIACGYNHVILLDGENNVYTCGGNMHGQLGLENVMRAKYFEKIDELSGKVQFIGAGGYFSLVVTLQNEILICGRSFIIDDSYTFKKVQQLQKDFIVMNVKCGGVHSIILNNQNELIGAGYNNGNQLGFKDVNKQLTTFENLNLPNEINGIKDIGCGYGYSAILTTNKFVYISGFKYTTFTKINLFKYQQMACLYETCYFLSLDGRRLYNHNNECDFNYNENIVKVYSGLGKVIYFLTENGKEIKRVSLNNNNINNENVKTKSKKTNLEKEEKTVKVEDIVENIVEDWKFPYLSVFPTNSFVVVLNSNYKMDEEESNEKKRMITLLFKQLDYSPFADIYFN